MYKILHKTLFFNRIDISYRILISLMYLLLQYILRINIVNDGKKLV